MLDFCSSVEFSFFPFPLQPRITFSSTHSQNSKVPKFYLSRTCEVGKGSKKGLRARQEKKSVIAEMSLVVQWLRLCAPSAGGLGLIPGQGTT